MVKKPGRGGLLGGMIAESMMGNDGELLGKGGRDDRHDEQTARTRMRSVRVSKQLSISANSSF